MDMYIAVQQALTRSGALLDGAETHGLICGYLCLPHGNDEPWLGHVLGEIINGDVLLEESRKVLLALKSYTSDQLGQDDLSFYPLLPDDGAPLHSRTAALGGWCEGFVLGLSMAGLQDVRQLSADMREFIEHLMAIARINSSEEVEQGDETAYMELVEYVRMGVLDLYSEQQEQQA